jgi:undecaprenyl-diphosphatase
VIFVAKLLHLNPSSPQFVFLLVMLHTGTMFAVLVYFWRRWLALIRPPISTGSATRSWNWDFLRMVIIATIVTGAIGQGLKVLIEKVVLERMLHESKGEIEQLFEKLWLIGTALGLVGLVILTADYLEKPGQARSLTLSCTFWIGLIQGICLPFRGFSRSGATISTGLFCGISRRLSEEFSFALAVAITPAAFYHAFTKLFRARGDELAGSWDYQSLGAMLLPGTVGMVFSFVSGLLALRLLSAVLESGHWRFFGFYCLFAAVVMLTAGHLGL